MVGTQQRSGKHRRATIPATAILEKCIDDTSKRYNAANEHQNSTNKRSSRTRSLLNNRIGKNKRQQLWSTTSCRRRLDVPLLTFLLLFLWVLGIVVFCQHRRNLLTTGGSIGLFRHHDDLLWNDHACDGVVHVIQTRFMQYQGQLLRLGRARLKLFETITLPSIVQQTARTTTRCPFLWIIRTDPQLAPELRARLIQLVEPYKFIQLVASNENPEGFRGPNCIADILPNTRSSASASTTTTQQYSSSHPIWSGSVETVRSYHSAAQSHPVLETRLDADDGLLLDFVSLLQVDALRRFHKDNNNDWIVWCAKNHMEWQYSSPWKKRSDQGGLVGLKSKHCVTAGLTFGYGVGSSPSQIPSHKHQQIHDAIPSCDTLSPSTTITADANDTDKQDVFHTTRCLARIDPPNMLPAAIRARTPTSAGMEHVLTGVANVQDNKLYLEKVKDSGWQDSQPDLFHELPKLFGIQPIQLWNVRAHIEKYLPEIVSDALAGQCTKGHSCKEESKNMLRILLKESAAN